MMSCNLRLYVVDVTAANNSVILREGFHDSAHVRESKFFSSPLHAVARTQATSFNCIVNEPVGSELIARV